MPCFLASSSYIITSPPTQPNHISMDLFLPSPTLIVSLAASLLAFYLIRTLLTSKTIRKKTPVEAAGAWPLIGHLPALAGEKLLHIVLGSMADNYGPLFTITLGKHKVLVVSDSDMARECLTTNDKVFANRPKSIAIEIMGYNYAMFAFRPYDSYWREVRKLMTLELLSNRRVEMFSHVHVSELEAGIKEIHESCEKNGGHAVVEMKQWFSDLTMNMIVRMIAGKRCSRKDEEGMRLQDAMRDFFKYTGLFLPSDYFPFCRWMDWGGYGKAMKRTFKELDDILSKWLEEHKVKRKLGEAKGEDFMDLMLSKLDAVGMQDFGSHHDADTINKSSCLVMLAGGTDTTMVGLTWALSLLLNNRLQLKKAQAELDKHIGKERVAQVSDLKNLVYLHAIIKETLRLYPPAPLLVAHEAIEDCTVDGYHVSAGTRLMVNSWKIHRDPRLWVDPEEFRPERFLGDQKNVDVRGHHFELIPFGSGRRMCPGISMSSQVTQLTMARLIHGFELKTPLDEPVDMSEAPGLTNLKATPLKVVISPRLPSHLYGGGR